MTCIVGLINNGTVWMGCDSFLGNSYEKYTTRDPKIVKRKVGHEKHVLLGFSGAVRGSTIIEKLEFPEYKSDPKQYVAIKLVNKIREQFMEAGYLKKENELESQNRLITMVGFEGRLFTISYEFNTFECKEPYQAIGHAKEIALGALFILNNQDLSPKEKLVYALKAAESHNPFVKGPYKVFSLK